MIGNAPSINRRLGRLQRVEARNDRRGDPDSRRFQNQITGTFDKSQYQAVAGAQRHQRRPICQRRAQQPGAPPIGADARRGPACAEAMAKVPTHSRPSALISVAEIPPARSAMWVSRPTRTSRHFTTHMSPASKCRNAQRDNSEGAARFIPGQRPTCRRQDQALYDFRKPGLARARSAASSDQRTRSGDRERSGRARSPRRRRRQDRRSLKVQAIPFKQSRKPACLIRGRRSGVRAAEGPIDGRDQGQARLATRV